MGTDLLRFRLDVLAQGVDEIAGVLSAYASAQDSLSKARNFQQAAQLQVRTMMALRHGTQSDLKNLRDCCRTSEQEVWAGALDTTLDILDRLDNLDDLLRKTYDHLEQLSRQEIAFDDDVDESLREEAHRVKEEIEDLRTAIEAGAEDEPDLWDKYRLTVRRRAIRLFTEYFDVLGGDRIRAFILSPAAEESTQLDDLCVLAKWHLEHELSMCADLETSPIALPGRGAESSVPFSPILRLGLTSWSLWGLPLEGHEWGRLVANKRLQDVHTSRKFAMEIQEFGEDGLTLLVSDVIGAFTEGPSYACALIFLVIDPGRETPEADRGGARKVSPGERIEVVMAVLEGLAPEIDAKGHNYTGFLTTIRERIPEGIVMPKPLDSGAAEDARFTLLRGLPTQVKNRFDLKSQFLFGLDDWDHAGEWEALIVKEDTDDESLQRSVEGTTGQMKLSHLWNAAWRAELNRPGDLERSKVETQRSKVEALVRQAARLTTDRAGGSRPTGGSRPSASGGLGMGSSLFGPKKGALS